MALGCLGADGLKTLARAGDPAHDHQRARGPAQQPAEHRCRRAAVADGRGGRRVRVGQDVTGHGHALRRGHGAVPGEPEHLQPQAADPGAAAGRGPDRPSAARAGAAAAPAGTGAAQHGRHHVRGAQRAAPDDVADGLARVPERPSGRPVDRYVRRGRSSAPWTACVSCTPAPSPSPSTPTARARPATVWACAPRSTSPRWFPIRTRPSRKARCCRGTPAGGGCRCMPRASSGSGSTCRTGR